MRRLIADKAYDADDVRAFLAFQDTEAVISPMPRRPFEPVLPPRRSPPPLDGTEEAGTAVVPAVPAPVAAGSFAMRPGCSSECPLSRSFVWRGRMVPSP